MAIPVIAATLGGTIVRALQIFLIFKGVSTVLKLLMAFGLTVGTYVALDQFVTFAANQIQAALSNVQGVTVYGTTIDVIGMIAATGIIDAINIVLSCHLTAVSIKSAKVALMGLRT